MARLAGLPRFQFFDQQTPGEEPVDALAAFPLAAHPHPARAVDQVDAAERFVGFLAAWTRRLEITLFDFSFCEPELTHPVDQVRLFLIRNGESQHN